MFEVDLALEPLARQHAAYRANYGALNRTQAAQDFMAGENYFDVGRSAVGAIIAGLLSAGIPEPRHILDFACGNGRVTRHLSLLFPGAEITVCDLYPEMVEFCATTFGARPMISAENLADLVFDRPYDLIWCGSLLTHCDAPLFAHGLDAMRRGLGTPGVAVATIHGRRLIALQNYVWKICPDSKFRPAERDFHRSGFGFVNTFDAEAAELFPLNRALGGGHSLSSAAYVSRLITDMDDATLLFYREMGWNGHQDVVAFGKPSVYPPDK